MKKELETLTKEQAKKITEVTSDVYNQGSSWVLKEWDLATGTERLTRGLSQRAAKRKLKDWRKEKLEEILRQDKERTAYIIRVWQENPTWSGEGLWHWPQRFWYTTRKDALDALFAFKDEGSMLEELPCEVHTLKTAEVPGNFRVA